MNKTNLKNKISKRIIISEIIYVVVTAIISLLMFLPIYKDRATLPGYDEEGNQIVVNLFYEKNSLSKTQSNQYRVVIVFRTFTISYLHSYINHFLYH